MHVDSVTSSACLSDFARVCVAMRAGREFPLEVKINGESGQTFTVRVEYSWRANECEKCHVFGHMTSACLNG